MKIPRLLIAFALIIVTVILSVVTVNASAAREKITNLAEEQKIREVIQNYFDKRYRSRQANQLESLRGLTDGSTQADSFLKSENDKLEIEIHNAKLYHLRYTLYKYTLDFTDISIDKGNQSATVSLKEGHDVVFEISELISKDEPIVSKMRDRGHTIILKRQQDGWKIVSDHYEDNLWRLLRATNLPKEELLRSMDEAQDQTSTLVEVQSTTSLCNLPSDSSTHPYNREGAAAYAHRYATSPNPAYFYFPDNDCTNFVNQAIHHGSNAEEVGSNTFGWYYNYYEDYLHNDYSASWTDVQFLYDFITQYYVWDKGPEGCSVGKNSATIGDLVQYNWMVDENGNYDPDDEVWDHGAIIVMVEQLPGGEMYPYVAAHSSDLDNYPYREYIYTFPHMIPRFIHIERIDGYAKSFLPLMLKNLVGSLQFTPTNPYPGPTDSGGFVQPQAAYPAP
jgi:Putative amidase domain